ncbi:sugar phosphate nucleotidyltransferase [Paenibacillus cellulositrophicus]|uniref:sugar phosphate nucleotidyltransferase n=1 Tax=Paenibacillus cellulositrophicus TaxID=562959 RepID=UPI00203CB139|nr:sugar phosphate nucleotidyltransferase [Paenibacillus cellulositrophicus]MCM2996629.1 sugar phosphate nucleotidyltransferase [Paenibacillus cellulositrophicus]
MKLVLLSGGSGKRLWPLSNDARSKQFLKVLENDNQELVSMVQRVWGQIENNDLGKVSYVATGTSQIEILQSQIGCEVPLIIEPERRDTFAAILLAAAYLYSNENVDINETVCILPVDPYVDDHFFSKIKELEELLNQTDSNIALIGVRPTYPSSKYGYIIPKRRELRVHDKLSYLMVDEFREKPSEGEAELLISQNALWNCGVFAFQLKYVIDLLIKRELPVEYDRLSLQYHQLPKISFDYEVVEKEPKIAVLPYNGDWKDLGTWNTLTEEMKNSQIGKGIISDDSTNSNLINEIDIPVAILGLPNIVVAVSPDGILVTDKNASTRIKNFIKFNQEPMYEERQWGWIRILDNQIYENGKCVVTKRVGISAGKNLSYRMQSSREEVWTIVKGEGEFVHNGNYMSVKVGNVLHLPMKTLHSVRALSDMEIIVVQTGLEQDKNQIIELFQTWGEVAQFCVKV